MLCPPYRPLFQPISMSSPGSAKSISNPRNAFGNLCRACDKTLPPTWAHALTPSRPCLASGLAPTSDSVIRRSGSGRLACLVVSLTALGLIAFAFGLFSSSAHFVMPLLRPSPGSLFTARLGHLPQTAILGWGLSVAITASPPSGLVLVFYASGKLVTLCISCSNPSGLRGKEPLLLSLGPGIHAIAETHLSDVTLPAVSGILSRNAHHSNRLVRSLAGTPVALRHSSTWAGTWSGVLTASDFPCHSLDISWPLEIWETGRVQLTSHQVGPHRILVATIYGYARGPTWPRAHELTEQMLTHLTEHLVVGYSGMAAIVGVNADPHELHQFDVWRTYGWEHAQQLSHQRWSTPIVPTCKGATQRDMIWLSPALASHCSQVNTSPSLPPLSFRSLLPPTFPGHFLPGFPGLIPLRCPRMTRTSPPLLLATIPPTSSAASHSSLTKPLLTTSPTRRLLLYRLLVSDGASALLLWSRRPILLVAVLIGQAKRLSARCSSGTSNSGGSSPTVMPFMQVNSTLMHSSTVPRSGQLSAGPVASVLPSRAGGRARTSYQSLAHSLATRPLLLLISSSLLSISAFGSLSNGTSNSDAPS